VSKQGKKTGFVRIIFRVLLGAVLLVAGLVVGLYSPGMQERLVDSVLQYVNRGNGAMIVDAEQVRLRFPLDVQVSRLSVRDRATGDTLIKAGDFYASVRLLPLLKGDIKVSAKLVDGLYVMGAPDSAMYLRAQIGRLDLEPARVSLGSPLTVDLENASISRSRVSIAIRPDSAAIDTAAKESTQMVLRAGRLRFVDFAYEMSLLPTVDSLGASFGDAVLSAATVDLGGQVVDIESFTGRGLNVAYITAAASESVASEAPDTDEPDDDDGSSAAPWTVKVADIGFEGGGALYTSSGYSPEPGMDFGYISVDSLQLHITDFYNKASSLRLPIEKLAATERCGVSIDASGLVSIDSIALRVSDFNLATPHGTALALSAVMGMGDMAADGTLPLGLGISGKVAPSDLAMMFPAAHLIAAGLPDTSPIGIEAEAAGTASALVLQKLDLAINRCVQMHAAGKVDWPMNPSRLGGDITLDGKVYDVTGLKNRILDRTLAQMFNIPPMTLDGRVAIKDGNVDGRIKAVTGHGSLAADGRWTASVEGYKASVVLNRFPVGAFLPDYGVGEVTATLSADGRGLNPLSAGTVADVQFDVDSAEYGGHIYRSLSGSAILADGVATVGLQSADEAARFVVSASGNLAPEPYRWTGTLDAENIDLAALKMSASPMAFTAKMNFSANISPTDSIIEVSAGMPQFTMRDSIGTVSTDSLGLALSATPAGTDIRLVNEDLLLTMNSPEVLDSVTSRMSAAVDTLSALVSRRRFDVIALQSALPEFAMHFSAGRKNLLARYLRNSDIGFDEMRVNAASDSILRMSGGVERFATGSVIVDTLRFSARQDSSLLLFRAGMDNKPGTFDDFAHVDVRGYLSYEKLHLMLNHKNIQNKTGFNIGAIATFADSTLHVTFVPAEPVIGYKLWSINTDNYLTYNFPHKHIDANLHLKNAQSLVELYTLHDSHHGEEGHVHDDDEQEDLILKVHNLRLSDWLSLNPFAPPVKGVASADMRVRWDSNSLTGSGTVGVDSLYYGKERVGDFMADIDLSTDKAGTVRAKAGLSVNGVRTIDITGNLNDSTAVSPFNLDFSMIHFPLATVNPFMAGTAKLRGVLNGKMDITGELSSPRFNGWVDFDSSAVNVTMLGSEFVFSETPVEVVDNLVRFKDFAIRGVNDKPLLVNGTVDITDLSAAGIDLSLKARDMGLVNTKRAPKGADVYGKAFIDLDGTVKGNMNYLAVDVALSLLAGTNVSYNIPDAANTIQSMQNDKMVRFVKFGDTTSVVGQDDAAVAAMAMSLDAILTIESGTAITVNLSSNGNDRLRIEPEGTLNYTQPPLSDGRLTGRLNIDKGFVRYSLPVLGEKNFDFKSGSYVNFTGPMMNPALNIQAVDKVRANVTQEGQNSRLVNFDVGLSVTGTLNTMNVAFDLSTDDDLTIANELQSMTAEQRSTQAMNLLLYGTYTGSGVKASANLSGNALYGFLESQINSWAANTIKGVDLSFGINQYDRTLDGTTSTTTQYSYKMSKSLFNDRFKIVVGGNYSTDADNDENFAQNLIKDISFEYLLNRQGTMYIRLFRHTGYESILEGEVIQTGVGFVYRRKIRTFLDMFRPFRKYTALPDPVQRPVSVEPENIPAETTDEKNH